MIRPADVSGIGEAVVNQIIESKLMTVSCPDSPDSGCVVVWSANAFDQIDAMITDYLNASGLLDHRE